MSLCPTPTPLRGEAPLGRLSDRNDFLVPRFNCVLPPNEPWQESHRVPREDSSRSSLFSVSLLLAGRRTFFSSPFSLHPIGFPDRLQPSRRAASPPVGSGDVAEELGGRLVEGVRVALWFVGTSLRSRGSAPLPAVPGAVPDAREWASPSPGTHFPSWSEGRAADEAA